MDAMRDLIDFLNRHTEWYDKGMPTISDEDWDKAYFELQELENKTGIIYPDSPTHKINYEVKSELTKVQHNHPLLSLSKTKSIEDLELFVKGKSQYTVMAKMDGLTISVRYVNGELVSAETRGDGVQGEDILHNAKMIKNLPQRINYMDELIVDGEAIITYHDFEKFSDEYANPRNLVSGSIRLLDSKESAKRHISFIAWKVYKGFDEEIFYSNKLVKIAELGFDIVPFKIAANHSEMESLIESIKKDSENKKYPIDGCVIGINNIKEAAAMGDATSHHERFQIAYKFYDEEYDTTLLDIIYDVSRRGVLTPVAVFKEVDTGDSVINKASLHNLSIMEKMLGKHPYIGQDIKVAKQNEIIPQVVWADRNDKSFEWEMASYQIDLPSKCPVCGGATEIREDGVAKILYCSNPKCDGKLANIIDHFAGKKGLDIKGLSLATINKLIDWGWLGNIRELYSLSNFRNEWIQKPGFGPASVDKILAAIEKSRDFNLQRFIVAIGIPEIGTSASKELVKRYHTWHEFRGATYNELIDIPGFGDIMVDYILHYDYSEADEIVRNCMNIDKSTIMTINIEGHNPVRMAVENVWFNPDFIPKDIDKVIDSVNAADNVNPVSAEELKSVLSLDGKIFCITGKLSKRRDDIIADIEARGGKVTGSVSKKTNYLVNNDSTSTSSKNVKAQQLGIPIITEEELYKLMEG